MKLRILTSVTKVESKQEYPRKPDGSINWGGKQFDIVYSTLSISQNIQNINGSLTVPYHLPFGGIYEIFFDNTPLAEVVEIQEVEAEYLPPDAEKP